MFVTSDWFQTYKLKTLSNFPRFTKLLTHYESNMNLYIFYDSSKIIYLMTFLFLFTLPPKPSSWVAGAKVWAHFNVIKNVIQSPQSQ